MKILERVIIAVGVATLAFLFWKLDAATIWSHVGKIGAGMVIIVIQQLGDHLINTWGWLLAFQPKDASGIPFWRLFRARIAGDGVNYLTPTATIAGEIVRPAMLGGAPGESTASSEAKIASVVVARFTQSVGQALFIMLGIAIILRVPLGLSGRLPLLEFIRDWSFVPMTVLALTLAAIAVYLIKTRSMRRVKVPDGAPAPSSRSSRVRSEIKDYFLRYPGRCCASIAVFTAGYFWGVIEAYLLCYFMGVPITVAAALAIEVLSSVCDGLLFMVPAKIGTQEAAKTAIFKGLGFEAAQGFSFGFVRHIRELVWAAAGFLVYALHRRQVKMIAETPDAVNA